MAIKFSAAGKQAFTDVPEYTVKAVKSFMGREGHGYECAVYKDGKRIGTVTDTADGGGMLQMNLKTREDEAALEAHCKALPKITYMHDGKEHSYDNDPCIFIGGLVEKFETLKQYKRWCRKQTVFRIDGDKEGQFRTLAQIYTPKIKALLEQKFPDCGLCIINEEI